MHGGMEKARRFSPGRCALLGMIIGACRPMKQRDEKFRNVRSNPTFPKYSFRRFLEKLPEKKSRETFWRNKS